jgi:hypothetical protein
MEAYTTHPETATRTGRSAPGRTLQALEKARAWFCKELARGEAAATWGADGRLHEPEPNLIDESRANLEFCDRLTQAALDRDAHPERPSLETLRLTLRCLLLNALCGGGRR